YLLSFVFFLFFYFFFFFFFQAEDGIRDLTVTGVQTCALPILVHTNRGIIPGSPCTDSRIILPAGSVADQITHVVDTKHHRKVGRSEERRVGKECRYRRWTDH